MQERYNSHLKNITIFNKIFLIQGSATGHIFCTHHLLKKKWEYSEQCISYLYTSRKPMIQVEGMPFVIFFLIEFGVCMKLLRLVKNVS